MLKKYHPTHQTYTLPTNPEQRERTRALTLFTLWLITCIAIPTLAALIPL